MNKKLICLLASTMLVFAGCESEISEENVEIVSEVNNPDEGYELPEKVTISDTYEKSDTGVSIKQVVEEWMDDSYKSFNIESHTLYQSTVEGCDYEDWVVLNIDCDDSGNKLPQQIKKVVKYVRNEADGNWKFNSAQTKQWIVDGGNEVNLGRTYWKQHFDNASDVNEKLFLDSEGNSILPEIEEGKEADWYIYFYGDFSFFYVSVNPNSENTREVIFYTEGSADLNYVYEGEVYTKHIHFIEGKMNDLGSGFLIPEKSDEYFEIIPALTKIDKEEYDNAVGKEE